MVNSGDTDGDDDTDSYGLRGSAHEPVVLLGPCPAYSSPTRSMHRSSKFNSVLGLKATRGLGEQVFHRGSLRGVGYRGKMPWGQMDASHSHNLILDSVFLHEPII